MEEPRTFHNLEKRERRLEREQIRRYKEWQRDSYRWMRIVNIMDAWGKQRVHVVGPDVDEQKGGKHAEKDDDFTNILKKIDLAFFSTLSYDVSLS